MYVVDREIVANYDQVVRQHGWTMYIAVLLTTAGFACGYVIAVVDVSSVVYGNLKCN